MNTLSLKTPLQAVGFAGKLLAHKMEWFGETLTGDPTKQHRVTRYRSTDPKVVEAQCVSAQALGIDGFISTWMGKDVSPFIHEACRLTCAECSRRGMYYALLLDPGIVKYRKNMSVTPEQEVINQINDPSVKEMLASMAYVPEKFILNFNVGVDSAKVQAGCPNIKFLDEHSGYGWPDIANTIPGLAAQNANPGMQIPSLMLEFRDGGRLDPKKGTGLNGSGRDYETCVWGGQPRRVVDHQGGNTYLDSVLALGPNASKFPYAAIVTWNDHDEGTSIEQIASLFTNIRIGA